MLLVVLRTELVLVLRHRGYLLLLEPVGVPHLYQIPRLRIHAPVGKTDVGERALYGRDLEREPTAVARDV